MTQELDSKKRKIRSLRGFFLYALEIMENGQDYEILETNLQPFFWRKVKDIIRQNKKDALQEFLFGKGEDIKPEIQGSNPIHSVHTSQASRIKRLENQIEKLHNKVDSLAEQVERLQEKIIQFEQNQTLEIKKALRQPLKPSQANKIHQQGNSTMKSEHSPHSANLLGNESEVRNPKE